MKNETKTLSETGIRGRLGRTLKIPPQTGEGTTAGGPRRPDVMGEGRRRVLLHLADHEFGSVAEMPRAWPVSKFLLRAAAAQLIARGLVQTVPADVAGIPGALRLTALGRREAGKLT